MPSSSASNRPVAPLELGGWRGPGRWLAVLLLWLCPWWITAQASGRRDAAGVEVAAAPRWVDRVATPDPAFAIAGARDGVAELLVQRDTRMGAAAPWHYYRTVQQIVGEPGLGTLGELTFEFAPWERLVLHRIEIHRGDQVLPRLQRDQVVVLRRERSLEARVFDGTQTAVVVLPDLRVGDVVVQEFSRVGRSPERGEMLFERAYLSSTLATGVLHVHVQSDRALHLRSQGGAAAPSVEVTGGVVDYRWHLEELAAHAIVGGVPAEEPWPAVDLGSSDDWGDVAAWARPLFVAGPRDAEAVARLVDPWRWGFGDAEARATAAIRFVQDDIRYLAQSFTEGTHRPASPADVIERRYGDCKDKSWLLVAMLRELGIEAYPVLVRSFGGRGLKQQLPSPDAFDHVIVAFELGGTVQFVDPTERLVRMPLVESGPRGLGFGLIIAPGSDDLVEIPDAPQRAADIDATLRYGFERWGGPVELDLRVQFGDATATYVRIERAIDPERTAQTLLDAVRREHPEAIPDGELDYLDRGSLGIVAHQRFRIGDWDERPDGGAQLTVSPVFATGRLPSWEHGRQEPLALPGPLVIHHEISLHVPTDIVIPPDSGDVDDGRIHSTFHADQAGRVVRLEYELHVVATRVEPDDLDALGATYDAVDAHFAYQLWGGRVAVEPTATADDASPWIALTLVLWGLFVVVVIALVHVYQPWARPRHAYDAALAHRRGWLAVAGLRVLLSAVGGLWLLESGVTDLIGWQWTHLHRPGSGIYDPDFAKIVLFETLADSALALMACYLVYAFVAKRRCFPLVFQLWNLAAAFVVIVGVVWASICCAELDVSTFGPIVGAVFAVIWAIYAGDSVRMRSTFLPVTSPPAGGQRGRYPSHQPHSGTLASDTIVP